MARMPREYDSTRPNWQHVCNRVAGPPDWFPLVSESGEPNEAGWALIRLFQSLTRVYFCRRAALVVTGNHYHAVLHFEAERRVGRKELLRRAQLLMGEQRAKKELSGWSCLQWKRFAKRLFQMPDMMHDLGGAFARLCNDAWGRRGPLWISRYKNTELLDLKAVQESLLYIELSAQRAGLALGPEQWEMSSSCWRLQGRPQAQEMVPLSELFPEATRCGVKVEEYYRAKLLWRGTEACRETDTSLPDCVARVECDSSLPRGAYLRRRRFFVEGRALGSAELVRRRILSKRQCGFYARRFHPIPQLGGFLFTLREQRSHARFLDWKPPLNSRKKAPQPSSRDGPAFPDDGGP